MDNHRIFSTLPLTPQRATPNSSRKMLHTPILFRNTASPSHHTRMSTLFQETASSLQSSMTPSRNTPTGMETPHLAASPSRFTRFGQASRSSTILAPRHECANTPDNNGLSSTKLEEDYQTTYYPTICATPSRSNVMTGPGRYCCSPTNLPSPKNLIPARNIASLQDSNRFQLRSQAVEPISSGFATPAHSRMAHPETPGANLDPTVGPWRMPQPPFPADQTDSDDDEHSTHGVRLVLPYTYKQAEVAQQANIDAWLEGVLRDGVKDINSAEQQCHDNMETKAVQRFTSSPEGALQGFSSDSESVGNHLLRSQQSSNKENVPPLPERTPSPRYEAPSSTTSSLQSPTVKRRTLPRLPRSTRKSSHPLTPGGHLSIPPRRKKFRATEDSGVSFISQPPTPKDNTVQGDNLAAALAQLSPSVERHRKGQGPKRERCASFWDTDILEPGSPAYPSHLAASIEEGDGKILRNRKQVFVEPA